MIEADKAPLLGKVGCNDGAESKHEDALSAGSTMLLVLLLLSSLVVMTLGLTCAGLGRMAWNGSQLSPLGIILSLIIAGIAAPFALLSGVVLYSRRRDGMRAESPKPKLRGL